jgi:small subunit ribosomal protein S6
MIYFLRMQKYELTLVLDGKASAAKKKSSTDLIEKVVAISKGKVGKVEDWGVKDLAFKIGKSTAGIYLYFPLELTPGSVKDLTAKIRANEDIIRYLLVVKEN